METPDRTSPALSDPGRYSSQDLWAENEAFARAVAPSMVFVAVLMLMTVPGTSLVLYVYGFRFPMVTQHFLFVCLAVSNLISGLVAMPTEIADLRFHLTFSSEVACRLLRFVSLFCALTSNCILVVIAVDRYRRICRPLHPQMTIKEARVGTALSVALSLIVSWPLLVITGLRTTETNLEDLYGKDCSFSDRFKDTVYPRALLTVLGAGFIIMTFTLLVLYTKIGRRARQHRAVLGAKCFPLKVKLASATSSLPGSPTQANDVSRVVTSCSLSTSVETLGNGSGAENEAAEISVRPDVEACKERESQGISVLSGPLDMHASSDNATIQNDLSAPEKKGTSPPCCTSFRKGKHRAWDKATLVAFTITLVFVLSFLPYLVLMWLRNVLSDFDHSLTGSPADLNAYNIFVRFYFLNSAVNPIIYGVFNARFRRECVELFKRARSCFCWGRVFRGNC